MLSVTFVLAFGEVYLFVYVVHLEVRHQPLTYLRSLLQEWFDCDLKSLNGGENAVKISLCIAVLLCFCWCITKGIAYHDFWVKDFDIQVGCNMSMVFKVIPQAICSRFGLAVGANLVWLVKLLMYACWPLAYPIGLVSSLLLAMLLLLESIKVYLYYGRWL